MDNQTQELQLLQDTTELETFGNSKQFEHAQRVAKALAAANIIPETYRNNIPNCMIALEMATRMGISPIMVMQNLYIVKGKPGWSGSFVIAMLNACGRFTPLRFSLSGAGDTLACFAYADDVKSGERIMGTKVTMAMAIGEGWVNKDGSKWKTMPDQMIQYRAGTFFGRLHAPDLLMGMQTADEIQDAYEPEASKKEQVKIKKEKIKITKQNELNLP